jgi:DNA-directed RNA polymerase subunit RPC12/RpoP
MKQETNCWLFLEKSDETRISKGIDGYGDKTGQSYTYDSLVPNCKNVRPGDLAIIRKEHSILGYGVIGDIKEEASVKAHRRCPECGSTDIRERRSIAPKWKCGKCSREFVEPRETSCLSWTR